MAAAGWFSKHGKWPAAAPWDPPAASAGVPSPKPCATSMHSPHATYSTLFCDLQGSCVPAAVLIALIPLAVYYLVPPEVGLRHKH
jgi:hypothetical protein